MFIQFSSVKIYNFLTNSDQFSSVKMYNFLTKVWIGKKFGSQSLASPTPSGLIAKVASPWGVIISNTNRKTQKRHKDKLPQEVQKKDMKCVSVN